MGLCMSTNSEEAEQRKRSQAIDRRLQEDSRRLRRECKILLLGATIIQSRKIPRERERETLGVCERERV